MKPQSNLKRSDVRKKDKESKAEKVDRFVQRLKRQAEAQTKKAPSA